MEIRYKDKVLDLTEPQIMGILNTTPDSFSDGGKYTVVRSAIEHAQEMIRDGATIIDIGGESTRPGAPEVGVDDELKRVIPVVTELRQKSDVWISVDTSKPEVMKQAIEAGADFINDIRALQEPGAIDVVAGAAVPVCIMHMKGKPRTMQKAPEYEHFLPEVHCFLKDRIEACIHGGIERENIVLDPGFGFGKTLEHNYYLLANLEEFKKYDLPILTGLSRKTMLHKLLNKKPAECELSSVVGAVICAGKGAQILRVHDVKATAEAITILNTMNKYQK
ncbi:dihydropteroate synthase [Vibrio salinus]|uniref:dihydropteroate synthase n=1 Tax=Vibrio salinus TaxID=2899784 RepID=UPI001E3EBC70|nr:dihydropteroate synthase [Vibrio salinus]MCE0493331.1 dihydropteroate synthase [Vibrio salinus]